MYRTQWQTHITLDPDIHHGEPCIKGTRVPVAIILGSLADGMTADEICAAYPQLTGADIHAALSYAADISRQNVLLPLPA